jgi:hypothetical protein
VFATSLVRNVCAILCGWGGVGVGGGEGGGVACVCRCVRMKLVR